MKVVILISAFLICEILAEASDLQKEDFKCVEGVSYKENNCNGCFCAGEHLACTEMACISQNDGDSPKCKVGTAWMKGCNKCWCTDTLGTVCTDKAC